VRAIATYLWTVADEAAHRGYHFDASKIASPRARITIQVTTGQLAYELTHLRRKLRERDPERRKLTTNPVANPVFQTVHGPIASWERTS
jgi:hypothetical protein